MTIKATPDLTIEARILVYTDGACSGNPGPGGWGSLIAWPDQTLIEIGGSEPHTTNNRMELMAAIESLRVINSTICANPVMCDAVIDIYTDSTYVIQGITKWIFGWIKRNWVGTEKAIANVDLWKALLALTTQPTGPLKGRKNINWKYVKGHAGIAGNERADDIAVAFAQGRPPSLYSGPQDLYSLSIDSLLQVETLLQRGTDVKKPTSKKTAKPYSYLSLIGGVPMRHTTWAQCELRVKGKSGAKFKKAMTEEEELKTLVGWGVDPSLF